MSGARSSWGPAQPHRLSHGLGILRPLDASAVPGFLIIGDVPMGRDPCLQTHRFHV